MKVLRITAQGLPLFKEELDISFFARMMTKIYYIHFFQMYI